MMGQSSAIWLVIVLAICLANAPFILQRFLGVYTFKNQASKALGWRMLELGILYALLVLLARMLEGSLGQVSPQGWEFYAVTVCLFLTFAFPGFVYRYLWNR